MEDWGWMGGKKLCIWERLAWTDANILYVCIYKGDENIGEDSTDNLYSIFIFNLLYMIPMLRQIGNNHQNLNIL